MKTDIWMPFYIGDYLKDTQHLSTEEHGAYFLILMELWIKNGSIPEKLCSRICKNPLNWKEIWDSISAFFVLKNGLVSQKRLSEEITKWGKFKDDKEYGAAVLNFKKHGTPIPNKFSQRFNAQSAHTVTLSDTMTVTPSSSSSSSSLTTPSTSKKKYIVCPEADPILEYLNKVSKSNYRPSNQKTLSFISSRIAEGHTIENFKTVIDKKFEDWEGTEFIKFLRPETLFGNKFESYLNATIDTGSRRIV